MRKIRRHYVFSGYVQGVGFRYAGSHTAQHLGITGWVRNNYDGTVEMEAEGTPEDLSALISALRDWDYGSVSDIDCDDIPTENDSFFDII